MKQQPEIRHTAKRVFVGQTISMSLVNNRTRELWSGFRPRTSQIENRLGGDFFNLQVYPDGFHKNFSPDNEYDAYALVEVTEANAVPDDMLVLNLPAGDYAVFVHKGGPATAQQTFQYIFAEWLPNSQYLLDNRPHFEVLGEKYSNTDPDSEEDVWIPVKSAKS